jgi:hypothetical protein
VPGVHDGHRQEQETSHALDIVAYVGLMQLVEQAVLVEYITVEQSPTCSVDPTIGAVIVKLPPGRSLTPRTWARCRTNCSWTSTQPSTTCLPYRMRKYESRDSIALREHPNLHQPTHVRVPKLW